jgi:hypothetical protein
MYDNFEENNAEIKKEYEKMLIDTLFPFLFRGLYSIYYKAKSDYNEIVERSKKDPGIKVLKLITIFIQYMKNIHNLPKIKIENETNKIRGECGKSDYLDQLIMACIKSYIVLLTYSTSKYKCKIIKERLHTHIDTYTFIHKCYIECCNIFINHAELFYDDDISKESNITLSDNDKTINKRYIYELIRLGIKNAIRNSLPMKKILDEYLNKDYPDNNDIAYNKNNFGDIVRKSLGNDLYEGDIIEDDNEEFQEDIGNNDANDLVFNRKVDMVSSTVVSDKKYSDHNEEKKYSDKEEKKYSDREEKKYSDREEKKYSDKEEKKYSDKEEKKYSSETKHINIENKKNKKNGITLEYALNEASKRKENDNLDVDIVRN